MSCSLTSSKYFVSTFNELSSFDLIPSRINGLASLKQSHNLFKNKHHSLIPPVQDRSIINQEIISPYMTLDAVQSLHDVWNGLQLLLCGKLENDFSWKQWLKERNEVLDAWESLLGQQWPGLWQSMLCRGIGPWEDCSQSTILMLDWQSPPSPTNNKILTAISILIYL